MKVTAPEDCGNAPRKEFIRDFNIAFAEGNIDKILSFMSDDIVWRVVGRNDYKGKKTVGIILKSMGEDAARELEIQTIITHGNTAAANGEMHFSETSIAFCDVYEFTGHDKNAKIKTLTSYGIELE